MLILRTCRTTIDEQGKRVTTHERRVRNVLAADISETSEPQISSKLNPAAETFESSSKLDGKEIKHTNKNSSPSKSSNLSNASGNGAKKPTNSNSMRDGTSTGRGTSSNSKKNAAKKTESVFPSYRPSPDFTARSTSTPEKKKNVTPDRQTFGNNSIGSITDLSPISPESIAEADRISALRTSKTKRTKSGPTSGAENSVTASVDLQPQVAATPPLTDDLIDFSEPSVKVGIDRSLIPLHFLMEDMKSL